MRISAGVPRLRTAPSSAPAWRAPWPRLWAAERISSLRLNDRQDIADGRQPWLLLRSAEASEKGGASRRFAFAAGKIHSGVSQTEYAKSNHRIRNASSFSRYFAT